MEDDWNWFVEVDGRFKWSYSSAIETILEWSYFNILSILALAVKILSWINGVDFNGLCGVVKESGNFYILFKIDKCLIFVSFYDYKAD